MYSEPPVGNYADAAMSFLAKAGEPRKDQPLSPKQRFFIALAKPETFSRFLGIVDLNKKQSLFFDESQFIHYYSAFVYALRTTEEGRKFMQSQEFDLFDSREKQWDAALNLAFTNPHVLEEFRNSTERHMQTTFTRLAIPVRLILNRLFENKGEITGYDFGCGLHIDLPALASDYVPDGYHFPPNDIQRYNMPVAISCGYGLDLNPANIDWVRACTSALQPTAEKAAGIDQELEQLIGLRTTQSKRYPLVSGNLFEFTPKEPVDFVITKKMRYQHKEDNQAAIKDSISRTLREGGYWITVAEENYFRDGHVEYLRSEEEEIWVYQKRDGKLVRLTDYPVVEVSKKTSEISGFDTRFFGVKVN